jgi:hypothetical protein
MKMRRRLAIASLVALFLASFAFAQPKQPRETRRPAVTAAASPASAPAPDYQFFSILDGTPVLLELHHDTEVGTNKPVDVYQFVIELQVLNSDGNLEPVGLQIFNFYTAQPQSPSTAPNPHNARDCKTWNTLVNKAIQTRQGGSATWPYVEFTVAQGARVVQTNEDGAVWWSDDIECWGSNDRFPPF